MFLFPPFLKFINPISEDNSYNFVWKYGFNFHACFSLQLRLKGSTRQQRMWTWTAFCPNGCKVEGIGVGKRAAELKKTWQQKMKNQFNIMTVIFQLKYLMTMMVWVSNQITECLLLDKFFVFIIPDSSLHKVYYLIHFPSLLYQPQVLNKLTTLEERGMFLFHFVKIWQ